VHEKLRRKLKKKAVKGKRGEVAERGSEADLLLHSGRSPRGKGREASRKARRGKKADRRMDLKFGVLQKYPGDSR